MYILYTLSINSLKQIINSNRNTCLYVLPSHCKLTSPTLSQPIDSFSVNSHLVQNRLKSQSLLMQVVLAICWQELPSPNGKFKQA